MQITPKRSLAPLLLLLTAFPSLAGCSLFAAPNPVNNQLRRDKLALEEQVAELTERLAATERVIAGLRDANAGPGGTTRPALSGAQLARLFTTHGLKFGRLTGGADTDAERPGDEALRVYVVPTDEAGQPLKAAGSFAIEAFDLADGASPRLGAWSFDVGQAKEHWRGAFMDYTYAFTLPWQGRVPAHADVTVRVRFVDELTRTPFTAQQVVKVKLPSAPPPPATGPS